MGVVKKLSIWVVLTGALITTTTAASAGQRTVTLAVKNMVCAVCAHSVKRSLEAVPGVSNVRVSLREMNAVVVHDDAKTDLNALTSATARAGFPAAPKN